MISFLLALLFMGSASTYAEDVDPFPDVKARDYQGYMPLTAQVISDGKVVTNAIVAVYCDDVLRGKNRVGENSSVYLSVYGNNTGMEQYLTFKVFTGGYIFTCNPEPAITLELNGSIGTFSSPYTIDITPVSLADDASNTDVLTTWKGKTRDVVLTGRTLYKDGAWNTLCLPFDVTIADSPLAGAAVKKLTASTSGLSGTTLTLNFEDETTTLHAGTPYIIMWPKADGYDTASEDTRDLKDPVFGSVTIPADYTSAEAIATTLGNAAVNFTGGKFVGIYSPVSFTAGDKTKLYLGIDNTLYWPNANMTVNACRAFFQLSDPKALVRTFCLNCGEGEQTGVKEIADPSPAREERGSAWYDMSGRRLNGKPTKGGVYINGGRKKYIIMMY